MDELAWVLVYVGAAWPVVLVVPSLLPRWKRGRVSERRWILCFSGYALLLTLAAILHAYVLTDSRPAPTALAYAYDLGVRAQPGWMPMERWLIIGICATILVALRSFLKKGHWFSMPPRRTRF